MTSAHPNVLYQLLNGAQPASPQRHADSVMMEAVRRDSDTSIDSNQLSIVQECNVVLLGSSKVGKTCLLEQLINNNFHDTYEPTTTSQVYRKALFMEGGYIYDLVLRDCPGVKCFPIDNVSEWTHYRGYGLLKAHVYVLVYDSSDKDTFRYVEEMRKQIMNVRGPQALIIVVGCKHDLVDSVKGEIKASEQKDCSKKWKCPFVMCSPKFNWGVMRVCAEIVKLLEMERESTKLTTNRLSSRWPLANCSIM